MEELDDHVLDKPLSPKRFYSVIYCYLFSVKKYKRRTVFQSCVGLKASLLKKRIMRKCPGHAIKNTLQVFTSMALDQDVIFPFDSPEGNPNVGPSTHFQLVRLSWISHKMLKKSYVEGARERHEQVGSHGANYLRTCRIVNYEKCPGSDDDSDYSMCTLYPILTGLFNEDRKRAPNAFFPWIGYVCLPC